MGYARSQLACWFLALTGPLVLAAAEQPRVEAIPAGQYPALLLIKSDLEHHRSQRNSLMIATFEGDEPHLREVLTAQSVRATPLADSAFLLEADQYPSDRSLWEQRHFLVDFRTGDQVLLSRSRSRDRLVHFQCLRSAPERNEAMLLRYGQGTDRSTLVHVDLATLATTPRYAIPRTDETSGFHGLHMGISPDFRLAAAMVCDEPRELDRASRRWRSRFSLVVLDLQKMEKIELVHDIVLETSPYSGLSVRPPPYVWTSPQEILYQDMIPEDDEERAVRQEGQYVLKCVNVQTGKVTEWLRKRLPLTSARGRMWRDRYTGELRYEGFTVDTSNRRLVPCRPGYSVESTHGRIVIRFRRQVLYKGRSTHYQTCPSHSGEHFAYSVRYHEDTGGPAVFAKTRRMTEPVLVSEKAFLRQLVAWVEGPGD